MERRKINKIVVKMKTGNGRGLKRLACVYTADLEGPTIPLHVENEIEQIGELLLESGRQAKALSEKLHSAANTQALDEYLKENPIDAFTLVFFVTSEREREASALELKMKKVRSLQAKKAADALHDMPGHSRDKKKQICAIWATGKYTSRDRCAEEECAALDMSFAAARKALRNTPEPA